MIDVSLSVDEISRIRHMIGYTAGLRLSGRTYNAYRNYYCTTGISPTFERLCKLGVVCRGERVNHPKNAADIYYHLTPQGAELVGNYLGVKIILN